MKRLFKKIKLSRLLCGLLCLCMVMTLMPLTAFAAGYGDKGYDTTLDSTYKIDGNDVFVYITGTGGWVERISGGDGDSVQRYRATANENWEFAYWSTYYVGPAVESSNPTAALGYYYFSKPGDNESRYDKTNPVIQVNEEVWAAGAFYLQAIFKPKVTVSVNTMLDSDAFISIEAHGPEGNPDIDHSNKKADSSYVPFGGTVFANLSGSYYLPNYVVESVTVHDGAPRNDFTCTTAEDVITVTFTATRPTNVQINIRLKEQIIAFDANTGSGTMENQSFDRGVEETLSANTFTKPGYVFDGWNTKADGTGTDYNDEQSVAFTPANDGDSITLYAQWEECTNHTWENSVCADCGLGCAHSGYSYSADKNVITETCEVQCGHSATATLNAPTGTIVYDGTEKEGASVSYSDSWQGEELTVSYENNVSAGTATVKAAIDGEIATATFTIAPASALGVTTPTAGAITYGQSLSDAVLSDTAWVWEDEDALPTVNNEGYRAHYTPADTSNYDWTAVEGWDDSLKKVVRTVAVSVVPKELAITWGETSFVYDGSEKLPEITVDGIVTGDDVQLITSGAQVNANAEDETYTATITGIDGADSANYKLPSNTSQEFTIAKADQAAPTSLEKTDETALGMSDGTITGATANMEYRKADETEYSAANGSTIENLAPGTYYVRYAGDRNHNPSAAAEITIEAKVYHVVFDFNGGNCLGDDEQIQVTLSIDGGLMDNVPWPKKEGHTFLGFYTEDGVLIEEPQRYTFTQSTRLIARYAINEYTVTVPAEQIGYKLETDVSKVEHGGEVQISFALKAGYKKTDAFAVKVNGEKIELTEHNNAVVQATEDLVITVEGVARKAQTNKGQQDTTPNTGDNSRMALWIALLFISGGTVITLTVVERKRKAAKR